MAMKISPATKRRHSLPLSEMDLAVLATIRNSQVHKDALESLIDFRFFPETSEAALLHAVFRAGVHALNREIEVAGYAQIAATQSVEERKAIARRRPPSWAEEE